MLTDKKGLSVTSLGRGVVNEANINKFGFTAHGKDFCWVVDDSEGLFGLCIRLEAFWCL